MLEGSNLAQSYALHALKLLKTTYPDQPESVLKKFVSRVVKEKYKDIDGVKIVNNYTKEEDTTSLSNVVKLILSESKPIFSSNGVLFHNHYNVVNNAGAMLSDLLQQRKDVKKMMFKVMNTDKVLATMLDAKQKTIKVLNNSWYGVMGQSSFIFYNKILGPSITATAQTLITTSIMAFERFLSNSIKFANFSELLIFINSVNNENYSTNVEYDENIINHQNVLDYLFKQTTEMSKAEYDTLNSILSNYDTNLLGKFYYKNKFIEFLKIPKISSMLDSYIRTEFIGEDPVDELKENLNELWSYLYDHVYYKEMVFNRGNLADTHIRESVIVVDTDSNFISLSESLEWLSESFNLDYENTDVLVSTSNMLIYLLSTFIKDVFARLTANMNIPEDKRSLINMKSEFLYDRLLLTNVKKSYAGILLAQEGNKLKEPSLDMKGLQIKKSSVNNATRKYFMGILENDILKAPEVNSVLVVRKFKEFENVIRDSINNGNIDFAIPKKTNDVSTYAAPYTQAALRGALLWNKLYPNNEIIFPAQLNMFKLRENMTLEEVKEASENNTQYEAIKNFCFVDEVSSKYAPILSIPKSEKSIPKWIIPLIDIELIQNDNITSAIALLESLGIKTMSVNVNKKPKVIYSNIVF